MIDLSAVPSAEDPEQAFAAVVALRRLADTLERKAVKTALRDGWSWASIAQSLGISKQAAHKRLAGVVSRKDSH